MNLDPITIILFLIFFVAPIVNNFLQRGRGSQQGQQGQRGQGRPQGRPTGAPQRRQERPDERNAERDTERNTSANTSRSSGSMGDEFRGRLEEARRRVQEAMSDGGGGGSSSRGQPQGERGDAGDLFPRLDDEQQARSQGRSQQGRASQQGRGPGSGRARQPFEGLGREGVSRQRPASQQGVATKQSSVDRTELGDAPPLRVQRLKPRKSSKIDQQRGVLEFDRRSVMQGIIWREILDEPLSKRRRKKRM